MIDLVGSLAVIATLFIGVAALGASPVAYVAAVVFGAVLAFAGRRLWVDPKAPASPGGWFRAALLVFGGGSGVYLLECLLGKIFHPESEFLAAGLRTGPFGGICTIAVTASIGALSLGGCARSIALKWHSKLS